MSLDSLAKEVIALQKKGKRLREGGDIGAWIHTMAAEFEAVQRLRLHLMEKPVVVTEDRAVKQLLKGIDLTDVDDMDKIGSDLLFSWISPAEYGSRYIDVSIVVTPFNIPENLSRFLDEARQCYGLGQFTAVQSLSRTILESAVNDIVSRIKGLSRKKSMRKCIHLIADNDTDKIYGHYGELCEVVHGHATATVDGPLGALTKTIGYVEYLYELNKDRIRE